jgi:hypothetical protein
MKRKNLAITLGILLAGCGVFWYLSNPSEEEFLVRVCETELADRLKSPSSYKRLEIIGYEVIQPTRNEYFGWTNPEKLKSDTPEPNESPEVREARQALEEIYEVGGHLMARGFIKYEASNTFGASIQGVAECSYVGRNVNDLFQYLGPTTVRVDGFTALEWSFYQLKELGG